MKIFLEVPFRDKDKAKRLGAKWDMARKVWFVENVVNMSHFMRWMPDHLRGNVSPAVRKTLKNGGRE